MVQLSGIEMQQVVVWKVGNAENETLKVARHRRMLTCNWRHGNCTGRTLAPLSWICKYLELLTASYKEWQGSSTWGSEWRVKITARGEIKSGLNSLNAFVSLFRLIVSSPWSESASELYLPSDRRLLAKWLPTFADGGCHVVRVTDPYGRILGFLDRSRYFSIK
jgi:hypothetical protein